MLVFLPESLKKDNTPATTSAKLMLSKFPDASSFRPPSRNPGVINGFRRYMGILTPTKEQWQESDTVKHPPGPLRRGNIVMINLLKFKADGGDSLYETYEAKVMELMTEKGLEAVFLAPSLMTVIGTEEWDKVILAKYPSLSTFIEMNKDPDYLKIVHLRMDALTDSRLIMVQP